MDGWDVLSATAQMEFSSWLLKHTEEGPPSAAIILHCMNCDQHFKLSMNASGNHVDMSWQSLPCPVDPCPYAEAHRASHES